jgi:hypothetical protein
MLVVALVAIGLWVTISFPAVFVLSLLLTPPMIGSYWGGRKSSNPSHRAAIGGMLGGLTSGVVLALLLLGLAFIYGARPTLELFEFALNALFLLPTLGFFLGWFPGALMGMALRQVHVTRIIRQANLTADWEKGDGAECHQAAD